MTPHATDDRALLLTPPGVSALAVVRLVGPGVSPFLARHFPRPVRVGRAVHGLLRDGQGRTLDDPVVVLIDTCKADVTVHGGRWVVRSVLELAAGEGFAVVPADGQDHATDARTDIEGEVVSSLPTAPTPAVVRMLLAQDAAWADLLHRGDAAAWRAVLADPSGWWLTHPPTVAIVGPPNVGKSTLANQLFGQQRSITADAPGTTRDWVGELADLGGLAVVLVDTPGVRTTDDPIEAAAIVAAGDRVRSADLTVLVLDQSRPPDGDARSMRAAHPAAVRVANKADAAAAWDDRDAIPTVATLGTGVDDLRATIRRHFGCEVIDPRRPRWWTDRQRRELERRITAVG